MLRDPDWNSGSSSVPWILPASLLTGPGRAAGAAAAGGAGGGAACSACGGAEATCGTLGITPTGMEVPKARAVTASAVSPEAPPLIAVVELRLSPTSGMSRGSRINAAKHAAAGAAIHTRGDENMERNGRACTSAQINSTLLICSIALLPGSRLSKA